MSISSLLSNSNDEPPSTNSEDLKSRRIKVPTKRQSFESPSQETTHVDETPSKSGLRRPSVSTQAAPRTGELDLRGSIDTNFSGGIGGSFGKKSNSSFKDFKYHDSMKVTEDADKSDTDVDDDVFQAEKQAYLAKQKKRRLELAGLETEKRKV